VDIPESRVSTNGYQWFRGKLGTKSSIVLAAMSKVVSPPSKDSNVLYDAVLLSYRSGHPVTMFHYPRASGMIPADVG